MCYILQATAIYQARQKLQAINQANNRKISSEELIKYAHKISASNAVAAPPTWAIGILFQFIDIKNTILKAILLSEFFNQFILGVFESYDESQVLMFA